MSNMNFQWNGMKYIKCHPVSKIKIWKNVIGSDDVSRNCKFDESELLVTRRRRRRRCRASTPIKYISINKWSVPKRNYWLLVSHRRMNPVNIDISSSIRFDTRTQVLAKRHQLKHECRAVCRFGWGFCARISRSCFASRLCQMISQNIAVINVSFILFVDPHRCCYFCRADQPFFCCSVLYPTPYKYTCHHHKRICVH